MGAMRTLPFAILFWVVSSSFGCKREPSVVGAQAVASASGPVVPTSENGRQNASHRLALSPPGASAEVDKLIEKRQASLALLPKKTDFWNLLGRLWVRKAR